MDVRIFTEPQQGATYDDLLAVAQATEQAGLDAFFRSDHYLAMGDPPRALTGPTDAWITLAGIARETSRIRLGTLLTAGTFRHPGPLAIAVAEVDQMSGGRVEFGLGAGWYEAEHLAYGIPFPSTAGERLARLSEQLEILTGLWATPLGETYHFDGTYYRLGEGPALPKPLQRPGPPVIVGGSGTKKTPALAARFAAEWNLPFKSPEEASRIFASLEPACDAIGRDPSSLLQSVALFLCCGRDEAEAMKRVEAAGRGVDNLQGGAMAGTAAQLAEHIGAYAALGVQRLYVQVLDLSDLEHIALIGEELAPMLAGL